MVPQCCLVYVVPHKSVSVTSKQLVKPKILSKIFDHHKFPSVRDSLAGLCCYCPDEICSDILYRQTVVYLA